MSNKDQVANVMSDLIDNFQNTKNNSLFGKDNENHTFLDITNKSLQQDLEDPKSPSPQTENQKSKSSGLMSKVKLILIVVVVLSVVIFIAYFLYKKYQQKQQEKITKLKERLQNNSKPPLNQQSDIIQEQRAKQAQIDSQRTQKETLIQKANELATQLEEEDEIEDLEQLPLISKENINIQQIQQKTVEENDDLKPVQTPVLQQTQRKKQLESIQESESEDESYLLTETQKQLQILQEETDVTESQQQEEINEKDEFEITI